MSDENQEHGLAPSNSTNATAIGAFIAATVVWGLGQKQIFFPAGYEALLGGFVATLLGYLPKSGRRRK